MFELLAKMADGSLGYRLCPYSNNSATGISELLVQAADGSLTYYLYPCSDSISRVIKQWKGMGCTVLRVLDTQVELPRY